MQHRKKNSFYPRQPLREALQAATQYGLLDLERVETMILLQFAREILPDRPAPAQRSRRP